MRYALLGLVCLVALLVQACRPQAVRPAVNAISKVKPPPIKPPPSPGPVRKAPGVPPSEPPRKKSFLKEFGQQAIEEGGQRAAEELLRRERERRQQNSPPPASPFPPETMRFPTPHLVQPLAGYQLMVDPETGILFVPNNFGGLSFYDANGMPLGFTALHRPSGEHHLFDPFGNRLR